MSSLDYEKLGTSAVTNAISKTNRLKPFVNDEDKEPSFDGNIYIYNNNSYSKTNLKRVSVQIKCKGVVSKPKSTIKYPISTVDLGNYMRNGGVMFFVVYIDKNTGDTKQIYYASLLPFKIQEILKNNVGEKQSISINFLKFPTNTKDITDLFLNFHSNAQKQLSFIDKEIPTIEDLQKKGLLESIAFSYISTQKNHSVASFPKLLDGKELYFYANIKGGVASIPVECCSQISHLFVSWTDDASIGVNGTIFYNGIEKTITADKIIYRIGRSVTISAPNVDDPINNKAGIKIRITVQLKGTLKQRIKDLEFLISMIKAKEFELDGVRFNLNLSESELKNLNPDKFPELLSKYQRALLVLKKMNVKKDLPLDDFTDEDYWKLNILVEAIENETPVKKIKKDMPCIVNLNFGGLCLAMVCQKQKDGSYKLWDYFKKQIEFCVFNKENKAFQASQYSIMKANDFLSIDNLRLQSIIDDFKRIEPQQYIVENGNIVMLEMLKAYDKEPKPELLEASKQMLAWLKNVDQFISEEIMLINSLQITRRERELAFSEKQELYKIVDLSPNNFNKIGALILLNERNEVEKLLNKLKQDEKDLLTSFPIFNFYTKIRDN